ncbi:DUF4164 family protein [Maritalea sp.]|jgi:prefoldin subunit 5|uniref:DUF4164 family protein n=1 Tax=Maritalea sp. TaxID=2003361 RepID=UPI0039E5F56A
MGENNLDLDSANTRLDGALDRLERQLHATRQQLGAASELELRVQHLAKERSRLADELDKTTTRAGEIEQSAKQVSLRIMGAMEKVQLALNGENEA